VTAPVKPFLHYTQEELDQAYDQRFWVPNAADILKRYTANSAAVRQKYPPRTEQYGPTEDETLDIFAPAGASGLPVVAYIHGGSWRLQTKDDVSAPAPTFVENGVIYVALNFACIPKVRLPDMADQCRRALVWLHQNAASFGGDPNRIAIGGHSSGGHLTGVMLTTDWTAYGAPANLLKAGLSMSGMYELHPVMLSARSSYVTISPEELGALSAMRHLNHIACPVIVAWGEKESPEFKRQSGEFATALAGMGRLQARFELPHANHFEVPGVLTDANSDVSRAFLAMLKG
jgi:arylformamidase